MLAAVRENPRILVLDASADLRQIRLTATCKLGTKRNGLHGAFIPSVNVAVETFYAQVVQNLKPWTPTAPKMQPLPEEAKEGIATAELQSEAIRDEVR